MKQDEVSHRMHAPAWADWVTWLQCCTIIESVACQSHAAVLMLTANEHGLTTACKWKNMATMHSRSHCCVRLSNSKLCRNLALQTTGQKHSERRNQMSFLFNFWLAKTDIQ